MAPRNKADSKAAAPASSLHADHRKRVRQRYIQSGEGAFSDPELLELYLFGAIPRVDVHPLALRLLDAFGSLHGVLSADLQALKQIPGIGESAAVSLRLAGDLVRRAEQSWVSEQLLITDFDTAAEYLSPHFFGAATEKLFLLCLDGKGRVLACVLLAEGCANSVYLDEEHVLQQIQRHHPTAVLLAHNHPGGNPAPSQEDIAVTQALKAHLEPLAVALLDHLIYADGIFFSLREQGFLSETN